MADSLAVTQKIVDQGLFDRFQGLVINVEDATGTPVATPVNVFIEDPATEEQPERAYPAVVIQFQGAVFDTEVFHSSDDQPENIGGQVFVTAFGPPAVVPSQNTRLAPQPYRLSYIIDTWHRVRAGEDRDLVAVALFEAVPPRGFMSLFNVDGEPIDAWVLWGAGGIISLDERHADMVVYHKSLTVDVLVSILDSQQITSEKIVLAVRWGVECLSLVQGLTGPPFLDPDGAVLDVVFEVTATGVDVL